MRTPVLDPAIATSPAISPQAIAPRRSLVPLIFGIVASGLLAIGSFLPWVVASIDQARWTANLAQALGVDPSMLGGSAGELPAYTMSGVSDGTADGMFTLVAGLVVAVCAVVAYLRTGRGRITSVLMLLAGLVGASVALYDIGTISDAEDEAIANATASLQALGLTGSGLLDGVINISAGIGIYVCALGGVLAVVAGVLTLLRRTEPVTPIAGVITPPLTPEALGVGPATTEAR